MIGSIRKNILVLVFSLIVSSFVEAKKESSINESSISEKILQRVLANHGVLLFQTLNYHWNLVGREFHDYHLLFDVQYKKLFEDMYKIS